MVRYQRHRDLFSDDAWGALNRQRIVVAGAGGLGSHVLDLLVRFAPVAVEVWDPAELDEPDLNRQSLYTTNHLGLSKVNAAADRLRAINPDVTITTVCDAVTAESRLGQTLEGTFDTCFDCLDSFAARAAFGAAIERIAPGAVLVHGGVGTFFGQVALLRPPLLSYRDVFGPDFATISTADKRVFPATVAVVAAMQVAEWLAWLRGERAWLASDREAIETRLLTYDGTANETTSLTVRPGNPERGVPQRQRKG